MISYEILTALALLANRNDRPMLMLSLVLGLGMFAPVPAPHFYLICALGEVLIALLALKLEAAASLFVVRVSCILVFLHGLGAWLNGYPPDSPYHLLVKICEHAELISCILLSVKRPKQNA
jgi:hypothetical protein